MKIGQIEANVIENYKKLYNLAYKVAPEQENGIKTWLIRSNQGIVDKMGYISNKKALLKVDTSKDTVKIDSKRLLLSKRHVLKNAWKMLKDMADNFDKYKKQIEPLPFYLYTTEQIDKLQEIANS